MKALELSPSFLIGHVHYWGRAFRDEILGPERANRLDPCASALKGGLHLHSDWSVTEIGPLRMVENAVTRTMRDGSDVLNPAERIPVEAALRMVTADAAWQCRYDFTGLLSEGNWSVASRQVTCMSRSQVSPLRFSAYDARFCSKANCRK